MAHLGSVVRRRRISSRTKAWVALAGSHTRTTLYRGYRLLHSVSRTSAQSTTSLLPTMCLQRLLISPSMKDRSTSWAALAATPFNWTSLHMDGISTGSARAVEVISSSSTDYCKAKPANVCYMHSIFSNKVSIFFAFEPCTDQRPIDLARRCKTLHSCPSKTSRNGLP